MAFHLDDFLPYRLAVAAQQVSRRFARLYAAEAGLTIPEWRVLVAKSDHAGDRRLIALELTPQGRDLMDRLGQVAQAFQDRLLQELGPDAAALSAALDRLAQDPDAS